jgi:tetratricopeptide (TPR) repeat protein
MQPARYWLIAWRIMSISLANLLLCAALLGAVACSGEPKTPAPDIAANTAAAPKDARLGVAFEALGRGDYATCRSEAEAVLADFPHHPRAEFVLALGLHKAKRYAEARPHFDAAAAATADFAGKEAVPYYRAWCEYWLGDFAAARADFERHLEFSDEGDSHFGLGAIALELGDFEGARAELQRALEIFEGRIAAGELAAGVELAKAHARLADLDIAVDDNSAARAHLEASLRLDPAHPAVWFKLYNVALDSGDDELAARAKAEYENRSPKADGTTPMATGAGR